MSDTPATTDPVETLMQAAGAAAVKAGKDEQVSYDKRKADLYAEDRLRKQTRALLIGAFVKARALNAAEDFDPVDIERLDKLEDLATEITKARLLREQAGV